MARGEVGSLWVSLRGDLSKLQKDFSDLNKSVESGFAGLARSAKSLGAALGIGFGVGAVIGFSKEVIGLGGRLEDLSQKTGISGKALSGLKTIAEQNSSSIDDFSTGISRFLRNLGSSAAEGDKVRRSLQQLGFTVEEIKNFTADPEDFIGKFSTKLADIENPAKRNAVAFEVMGRQGANLIPTLLRIAEIGFPDIKSKGLDDETIRRLKLADDAFISIKNSLQVLASTPIASFASVLGSFTGSTTEEQKLRSQLELIDKAIKARQKPAGFLGFLENKAKTAAEIEQLTEEKQVIEERLEVLKKAKDFKPLDIVSDDTRKKLDDFIQSLQKQGDQLKISILELTAGGNAAKALGLDLEFAAYKANLLAEGKMLPAGSEEQFKKAKEAILGLNDELGRTKLLVEQVGAVFERDDQDLGKAMTDLRQWTLDQGVAREELIRQLSSEQLGDVFTRDDLELGKAQTAFKQRMLDMGEAAGEFQAKIVLIERQFAVFGGSFDVTGAKIGALTSEIERLLASGLDPLSPKIQALKDQLTGLEGFRDLQTGLEGLFNATARGLQGTLQGVALGTQSMGEAFRNLGRNVLLSVSEMIVELLILKPLLESMKATLDSMSIGDSGSGGVGGFFGKLFGGIFGSLFGGAPALDTFGGQHGLSGIVRRPTRFIAGEGFQPERVQITPLSKMNGEGKTTMLAQVVIKGGVIPDRGVTPDQVVQITYKNIRDDGILRQGIREYGR